MKCPIKKLESDCIQGECPLFRETGMRCGYAAALFAVEEIAEYMDGITMSQLLATCRSWRRNAAEVYE